MRCTLSSALLFLNSPARTEIYTLSLHDALPISELKASQLREEQKARQAQEQHDDSDETETEVEPTRGFPCSARDRKSTRLNSSHTVISYAVFCLKKKTRTRPPCKMRV